MAEEYSEETRVPGGEQTRSETRQAWEEVGRQFEELGTSLAAAFRALWESQETQQHMVSVREGLRSLADEVSEAVTKTAASPEAQRVQVGAKKAAASARAASEKAIEETRPQIISALRQMNAELQKLINRLETEEKDVD
jgi:hypothetical protein